MTVVQDREELPTWAGFYSLAEVPQRGPIDERAFGAGWPELDEILKFYLGQFVVVTGMPGSGKSMFILNCLVRLAKTQGTASFMYVPENEQNIREIMRRIWDNESTWEQFSEMQCFIQSSEIEHYDDEPKTIHWVLDRVVLAVHKHKVEVVLIDPWNELERAKPKEEMLTDYIGRCLAYLKQLCRAMNVIVIIVAHPTKPQNRGSPLSLYDIEGSAHWFNKADNGLICAREHESNRCAVTSAKVREIGAGRTGVCYFQVDPRTGLFTPEYGGVTL